MNFDLISFLAESWDDEEILVFPPRFFPEMKIDEEKSDIQMVRYSISI